MQRAMMATMSLEVHVEVRVVLLVVSDSHSDSLSEPALVVNNVVEEAGLPRVLMVAEACRYLLVDQRDVAQTQAVVGRQR